MLTIVSFYDTVSIMGTQEQRELGAANRLGSVSNARLKELYARLQMPLPPEPWTRYVRKQMMHAVYLAQQQHHLTTLFAYPTPSKQAARIMARFGGAAGLAEALNALPPDKYHRERTAVYKWLYPRERGGTDGMIPRAAEIAVKMAARSAGVFLAPEDWVP